MFVVAAIFSAFVCFLVICILVTKIIHSRAEIPALAKRAVFITGCDTGFGNLLAKTLDRKGLRVFAGCLTEDGARTLREASSTRLRTVLVDITKKQTVLDAYAFVAANLDENGIHHSFILKCL